MAVNCRREPDQSDSSRERKPKALDGGGNRSLAFFRVHVIRMNKFRWF